MKTKFTDIDQFNELRQNALNYMRAGYPECDSGMIPIVLMLNACESIAVRWCCESHPTDDENKDHFYVALAVRDQEGLDYLTAVYEKTMELIKERNHPHFIDLAVGFLYYDDDTLWRRWLIEAYTDITDKDIYLESLYKGCKRTMEAFGYTVAKPVPA